MPRWITLFAVVAVLVAVPLVALAQEGHGPMGPKHPGHGRKPAHGPEGLPHAAHAKKMFLEAGATEEQLEKLHEMMLRRHLGAIDLKAAIEKAELTLHHMVLTGEPEERELLAAIDAVTNARGALAKHVASGLVEARTILGPEVWEKVKPHVLRHAAGPMMEHAMGKRGPHPMPGHGMKGHGGARRGGGHGGCDRMGQRPPMPPPPPHGPGHERDED
jgi:Spy/CpxP family protein refolding chaperone